MIVDQHAELEQQNLKLNFHQDTSILMIFAGARSYHMIALHLPFMPIQTRIILAKISKFFNSPAPAVELK